MKEAAEPYLPALAGLLDDPDADVRQRAVGQLARWGGVPFRCCGGFGVAAGGSGVQR